jgi:hypothetical protein
MSLPFTSRSRGFGCALAVALLLSGATAAQATADTASIARAQAAAAATAALHPQLPSPIAATAAEQRAVARAAATGTCPAQILKNGTLVTLKTTTYQYRYVKIKTGKNKGKYARTIVRVSVAVSVSCSKQCVAVVKKRGKYQPVYSIRTVKVKAVKRGRIVTVKKRARVYRFVDCSTLPSAESLGTPVSVTILPGSYALLDFGAFQR